jgi:TonB family protein
MRTLIASLAFLACLVAGCATTPEETTSQTSFLADGVVAAEIVDKPSSERYEIRPGEQFFSEVPRRENVRPAYPTQLLVERLGPISVTARIVVNASGEVEKAEIVESSAAIPQFSESVLAAVKTWTFLPLKRVVGNKLEPLPFTQDYKFTFKQENGRAVVVQGSPRDS